MNSGHMLERSAGLALNPDFSQFMWNIQKNTKIYRTLSWAYINGHFRNHKIWPYMVQYLHLRILKFPLIIQEITKKMTFSGHLPGYFGAASPCQRSPQPSCRENLSRHRTTNRLGNRLGNLWESMGISMGNLWEYLWELMGISMDTQAYSIIFHSDNDGQWRIMMVMS